MYSKCEVYNATSRWLCWIDGIVFGKTKEAYVCWRSINQRSKLASKHHRSYHVYNKLLFHWSSPFTLYVWVCFQLLFSLSFSNVLALALTLTLLYSLYYNLNQHSSIGAIPFTPILFLVHHHDAIMIEAWLPMKWRLVTTNHLTNWLVEKLSCHTLIETNVKRRVQNRQRFSLTGCVFCTQKFVYRSCIFVVVVVVVVFDCIASIEDYHSCQIDIIDSYSTPIPILIAF